MNSPAPFGGRVLASWMLYAAVAGIGGGVAGNQQPAAAKQQKILLSTKPDVASLVRTLEFLSRSKRSPFGIEIAGARQSTTPRDAGPMAARANSVPTYDLTTLSLADALNRCVSVPIRDGGPTYEWSSDGSAFDFRPRGFAARDGVALSQRVNEFHGDFENPVEAMIAVHRIFDPSYRKRVPATEVRAPMRVRLLMDKRVVIETSGLTVREILDRIVEQHGGMLWVAEYANVAGSYDGIRLSFVGFDGWEITMEAAKTR